MDIIEIATEKIKKKYKLSDHKAKEYAEKAVKGLREHGGNPNVEKQLDSVIEVVVKAWIEGGY